MDILDFQSISELAKLLEVVYEFWCTPNEDVAVLAKYNEAAGIIKELCCNYPIKSVKLRDPMFDNYYDEYIISLNSDGIWCEPAKIKKPDEDFMTYLYDEPTYLFVLDNCNSKVLSAIKGLRLSCEVRLSDDSDEGYHADDFTPSKSYKINGKEADRTEFEKFATDIQDKYSKSIHDFLVNWCAIMDELNDMRVHLYD